MYAYTLYVYRDEYGGVTTPGVAKTVGLRAGDEQKKEKNR